ncbi:MAG: asparagine synthase (glutamine-hydrolyzing) [Bacteroidota bacterium]|nr:asparagine synthase (glutamine-hydrolyzing) [Bacteroidota bacterium]
MCGIAGFVDFRKQSNEQNLRDSIACLNHRGPDGDGVFVQETLQASIGLGHRRLSIIDLSNAASQPMHFDGLHIVFNGEIYNYAEIREDLLRRGHQFSTHSDTEVILHAWREWGPEAIKQWHGMFAIVLFDEKKNEIVCIRDRAGVKPFYYYWQDDIFLFGSELKGITQHASFKKKINVNAVASFLQYGYISHPHCIYEHTYKLQPGHYLRLDLESRRIANVQYWNVYTAYNKPKLNIDLPEAIEETEKVLAKSFQYRMVADVPVGVFLSGGYDSSCVTALLQKNSQEKIKTFTIGTTDEKLNEAPFAKQIAARLGTDHTEYYCTAKEALDIIPELPHFYDEPFADSSAIPTILVSRLARRNVTVALSADAGDEIFAGYNRYDYISRYGEKIRQIPRPVRKAVSTAMSMVSSQNIPYFSSKPLFHSRYDKLKNLLIDPSTDQLLKSLSHVFTDTEVNRLFQRRIHTLSTAHVSTELEENNDPLAYMMAVDYQTYLVDDILQKVDRATMSVSLEGREPFLDQDIIEWAATLPTNYKYRNGEKKYILKQIVHKYLPKEMMERPKMGFAIPVESWLRNELKDLVQTYLSKESLDQHGLFVAEEVQALVADFYKGHKEKYTKIWYLLMFQMWYEKWMA